MLLLCNENILKANLLYSEVELSIFVKYEIDPKVPGLIIKIVYLGGSVGHISSLGRFIEVYTIKSSQQISLSTGFGVHEAKTQQPHNGWDRNV